MIDPFLLQYQKEINALCLEHEVSKLYAFGSIVDGRFQKGKSDIDLLIEFDHNDKQRQSKSLFMMWIQLQDLFGHKVDLVTSDKLKGKYFKKYLDLYKEILFSKEKTK